jgi:hypothetical protein
MTRPHAIGPRWAPLLLLAVLVLGGTAHLGHHLADPGCDSGREPHPCASCAALHGAALAAEAVAAQPPVLLDVPRRPLRVAAAPAAAVVPAGGPRAPPVA